MKRTLQKTLLILVAAIFGILCLGACKDNTGMAGTYSFHSLQIEKNGIVEEYVIGDMLPWGFVATKRCRTIQLKSNGVMKLSFQKESGWERMTGIWEEVENEPGKIRLTVEDTPIVCSCDGSTIVLEEPKLSYKMILKK